MRALNFAEVRAAGLPARVRFPYVTYEYRPLGDDVAVRLTPARKTQVCTTSHMPWTGWLHQRLLLSLLSVSRRPRRRCACCRARDIHSKPTGHSGLSSSRRCDAATAGGGRSWNREQWLAAHPRRRRRAVDRRCSGDVLRYEGFDVSEARTGRGAGLSQEAPPGPHRARCHAARLRRPGGRRGGCGDGGQRAGPLSHGARLASGQDRRALRSAAPTTSPSRSPWPRSWPAYARSCGVPRRDRARTSHSASPTSRWTKRRTK